MTIRTSRVVEQIGLSKHTRHPQHEVRTYTTAEVHRLQDFRFLTLFEMPHCTIQTLLDGLTDTLTATHFRTRTRNSAQRDTLSLSLTTLDTTLEKGVNTMTEHEKFAAFKTTAILQHEEHFGKEVRDTYGEDVVEARHEKFRQMSTATVATLTALTQKILEESKPLVGTTD